MNIIKHFNKIICVRKIKDNNYLYSVPYAKADNDIDKINCTLQTNNNLSIADTILKN